MEKKLYRSRKNRMIGGVCGGIAEYSGIDASIVRLGWIILTLFSMGIGLLAYVAAMLIIPEEPQTKRH